MSRLWLWAPVALLLIALPFLFSSGSSISTLNIMGVMIVFALSYNMLFGQTGMLSFGHAVFYGLSGFCVVHMISATANSHWPIPLVLMPALGGAAGWVSGVLLGAVATRRSGTAFAMISLGISELVLSLTPILKSVFGGEEGIHTDRTKVFAFFGISFSSQLQVYFLIAAWCLLSMVLLHEITRTPFGRLCNAVRENAQRADFLGYNVGRLRRKAFTIASVFAGVAGALAAVNFETVTVDSLGGAQSTWVLFMTYVGGVGSFFGPVIGAVVISLLQLTLPAATPGWQLYLGLFFIIMVMYAPRGIAGLISMHEPVWRARLLHKLLPSYLTVLAPILLATAGLSLLIEMSYHRGSKPAPDARLTFLGLGFDSASPTNWIVALALLAAGLFALGALRHRVTQTWPVVLQEAHRKLES